tara:strand:- start:2899 stop:3654 length:756 start_codon:yes stop_codon:yes gene_type:complete
LQDLYRASRHGEPTPSSRRSQRNTPPCALISYRRIARSCCQIPVVLLTSWLLAGAALPAWSAAPVLAGRWQLDADTSTDPATELKGIRASKIRSARQSPQPSAKRPGQATEQRYWQEANAGEEWRHSKELVHAGPLQRILESENLEIITRDDGYLFVYADGFERPVVPNPAGRVFTASGEELVKTDIGYTLAYWEDDTLVLETRIERGGEMFERIAIDPDNRLGIHITIDRRDWKWIARLERVFAPVPGSD